MWRCWFYCVQLNREEALAHVLQETGAWDITVATTGFLSRELYELRDAAKQDHRRDFLTVGSMGHASAIAMGISVAKQSRQVICFDGDGAALMHMGTMATIGTCAPDNLKHIIFNNGSHDSVGGQPTKGFNIDFCGVAKVTFTLFVGFRLLSLSAADIFCPLFLPLFPVWSQACGYKWAKSVSTADEIHAATKELRSSAGPAMLEIRINKGARKNLGRPKTTPVENKADFMRFVQG